MGSPMPDEAPSPLTLHDVGIGNERVLAALADLAAKVDRLCEDIAEIRALRADLARLADDVAELAARTRLSRDELRTLERLLPTIATAMLDKSFSASDVFDFPVTAGMVEGHSATSLAWLFARACGRRIGRYRLEAAGRDRTAGRLWSAMIA